MKSEPVRRRWENMLSATLKQNLPGCNISKMRGRIWVSGDDDPYVFAHTFGIASYSPCVRSDLATLNQNVLKFAEKIRVDSVTSFAIRVHRVGNHPFTSQDLAREVGNLVKTKWPFLKVDLTNPESEIHIAVRDSDCYLFTHIHPGPGGLPIGSAGRMVGLLSGGIDSPVAMYMMMKRGVSVIPIYVKIFPFHDDRSEDRVRQIINHLSRYQQNLELIVIDDSKVFGSRQKLRAIGQEKYACVLCKRHLYRIAENIAINFGAKGIITGESLAQVASQTSENLYTIDKAVGVDSALLSTLARGFLGPEKMQSILVDGPEVPRKAVSAALKIAESLDLPLKVIPGERLSEELKLRHPPDRCRFCKLGTYKLLSSMAEQLRFTSIADGANASDLGEHRPGIDAFSSCGVIHPFIMAGITKSDIREISREMGYSFWDKPSSACLYSRIPYGEPITEEKLVMIENGEEFLEKLGLTQCRVRHHGSIARIEVLPSEMVNIFSARDLVKDKFIALGFLYVTLDLCGYRSGSMDEVLDPKSH